MPKRKKRNPEKRKRRKIDGLAPHSLNMSKTNEKDFNYPMAVIIFVALTVLVIILSLKLNDSAEFSNQIDIESGILAPDFTFPGLDGKMVSLSDYKGKVVLVNIWATWCPPCVREMPSMEKLYAKFNNDGFTILAIDMMEEADSVRAFKEEYKLNFPILLDFDGSVAQFYNVMSIPTTYIVDQEGYIIGSAIGTRDWASEIAFMLINQLLEVSPKS